jgi:hypothetical protein
MVDAHAFRVDATTAGGATLLASNGTARTAARGPRLDPATETVQPRSVLRVGTGRRVRTQCLVPGAAGGVTATAGAQRASLTWTAAAGNGSPLTGYLVRETAGPDIGASIGAPATATSAVLPGLAGGTAATFSVTAVSACGNGPAATSSAVTPTGSASSYLTTVLSAAPSVYYRLGEPAGTGLMADSSGAGLDGQYTGQGTLGAAPALANDPTTSLSFTTCCTAADTSPAVPPSFNSARTVEAWVDTSNAAARTAVVGYGGGTPDQGFTVGVSPHAIFIDGRSDFQSIATNHNLDDGTWHQVAVTYDGTTISAYLDGQPMGTAAFSGSLNTIGGNLAIGAVPGYSVFDGLVQDVAIFPSALSAAQIGAQFAASGYAQPGKVAALHVSTAGPNAVTLTWGLPSGPETGVLVSAATGPDAGQAQTLPAQATAARLQGLAAGSQTFQVQVFNTFGAGPPATSAAFTVTGAASTFASTILADAPSAFYRLGDTNTKLLADSSGNHADGLYQANNVTLGQPGPLPGDPTSSTQVGIGGLGVGWIPGSNLPAYDSARTIEAWVDTTVVNANGMALLSWGTPIGDEAMSVLVYPGAVGLDADGDLQRFATPYPVNDGVWHLVTLTYDGTTITAYLDGVELGTGFFRGLVNTLPAADAEIGGSPFDGSPLANSGIADLAVYPTALSAAQVSAQFAASGYARPAAPGSPGAAAGANAATVSWTAAASPTSPVKDYLVTALAAGKPVDAQAVPATTTSTTVNGLRGGTSYTFTVTAADAYGAGPAATTAAVTPTGSATTYASTVLTDKPSVFYRLGDTTPSLLADSSGHRDNGLYVAGDVTQGQSAAVLSDPTPSVSAGGSQGVGSAAAPNVPGYNSPRTIEAWIDIPSTNTGNAMALVSWGAPGATDQGMAAYVTAGAVGIDGYDDQHQFATPYPIEDGLWHLVTLTYDGTTITAYLDGLSIGTAHFAGALDTIPGSLAVGAITWGGTPFTNGELADVAVYPTALKAARVAAHFAASGYARPAAPGAPGATAGANAATVSWTASASPTSLVKDYLVTALAAGKAVDAQSVPASATSTTISGLAGGTAYTFTIAAADSYGSGPAATTAAVTPTGSATTYASTVLADKPSLFYRLADATPNLLADSSGHQQNGLYVAGDVTQGQPAPLPSDPTPSLGVNVNGRGVATAQATDAPAFNSPRTLEAWIDTTNPTTVMTLVSWGAPGEDTGTAVYVSPGAIAIDGGEDERQFATPYPIDDGVWHQVAVTYDGTTITAYLDGSAIGTAHFARTLDTLPGALSVGIGSAGSPYTTGLLADLAVYPTALSAARVSAHFAASGYTPPSAPGTPSASPGANAATVSWTAATSSTSPVKDYLVTALTGGHAVDAQSVPAGATSTTLTGLRGGTSYTFTITAVDAYGAGPAATTAAVTPTGNATTYASTVLADQPSVFYRLGDGNQNAMADSSGNAANGLYLGSNDTFGTAGAIIGDPATSVTGSGGAIGTRPNAALPAYGSPRTIEGWVQTSSANTQYLGGWGAQLADDGFDVGFGPNDVTVEGYTDNLTFASPTVTLDDGHWHFVVVTSTGTTATAYVDGSSLGTQTFAQPLGTAPGSTFYVGSGIWGFNGVIGNLDDVAVFPTALAATRIQAQYAAAGY